MVHGLIIQKSSWIMGKLYTSLFIVYECVPLVISIPMSASTNVGLDEGLPHLLKLLYHSGRFLSFGSKLPQLPVWNDS